MKLPLYQIDAFTDRLFVLSPALYCSDNGESVSIAGYAKTYSIGTCWTE